MKRGGLLAYLIVYSNDGLPWRDAMDNGQNARVRAIWRLTRRETESDDGGFRDK